MRVLIMAMAIWLLLSVVTAMVLSVAARGARHGHHVRRFAYRRRREDMGHA